MKLAPLIASNYYHFYNRGNNKENIFIEEENYYYFLMLLKKYLLPIVDIYSYCLLPNHFHLLLRIKDDSFLPVPYRNDKKPIHQPFSNLFNAYTKAINKKYNRTGSLFQKHPKRVLIENEMYLRNLIVYINTNPSHHQISDYTEYKFSSYQALVQARVTLLKKEEVIELFDDVSNLKFVLRHKKMNLELIRSLLLDE